MQRIDPRHLLCLLALAGALGSDELQAVELLRGPYLQNAAPNAISIRWRTDLKVPSQVNFGQQPGNLALVAFEANPTTEHEVRLTDLVAGSRYYYAIGTTNQTLADGDNQYFVTSPEPGSPQPTRIWVTGDSGGYSLVTGDVIPVREAYHQFTGTRHTDVWLVLGDNAYDFGLDSEYQGDFFNIFPAMMRKSPPWPTIGNHETYSVPPGQRFPYLDIFSCPTNGEAGGVASGTEHYYSFDHANIHFVCLDSMSESRATNGPMADWLRADLAASTNAWLIAYWHHPPYSRGTHDSDFEIELIEMRQNILPLLEAYGVDLVLSGHSHDYERSYLVHGHYGKSPTLLPGMILDAGSGREHDTGAYVKPANRQTTNQGSVYVVMGSSCTTEDSPGNHPIMYLKAARTGSLVLDVNGHRLDARFLRGTGAVDDQFTILKGEPEPLRMLPLQLTNGQAILRWKSTTGRQYGIERKTNWSAPTWEAVGGPITATGATSFWTNAVAGASANFYRVVELPPPSPLRAGSQKVSTTRPTQTGLWLASRQPAPAAIQFTALTGQGRPRLPNQPDRPRPERPLKDQSAIITLTACRAKRPNKNGPAGKDHPGSGGHSISTTRREFALAHTPWLKQTRQRC